MKEVNEITLDTIIKSICEFYETNIDRLSGKSRKRELVEARQCYMYFSILYTKTSFEVIGTQINRDHSTVTYGNKLIKNLIEIDRGFSGKINKINALIIYNSTTQVVLDNLIYIIADRLKGMKLVKIEVFERKKMYYFTPFVVFKVPFVRPFENVTSENTKILNYV